MIQQIEFSKLIWAYVMMNVDYFEFLKMKFKAPVTAIIFSFLLVGCQKSEVSKEFTPIKDIINPTETKISERTPEWYKSQENIREQVIDVCLNYFMDKADQVGGAYKESVYDDVFSAFKEYPDCTNAREGYILSLYDGKNPLTEAQLMSVEREVKDPKNLEHINNVAEQVAKRLESLDKEKADIEANESSSPE